MAEERGACADPSMVGQDEQVFQVQCRQSEKARIGLECECVAYGPIACLGKGAFDARLRAEQILLQAASCCCGGSFQLFVVGECVHQAEDGLRVAGGCRPDYRGVICGHAISMPCA
jgi:hypothetical protein